ncbi:MAG: hypothetical protein RBT11_05460 [Desulfobacterales bacterium]|jgi:hypothetical protein|nr:hypothetical protein [Desulfobacterales bacterium]
MRQKYVLTKSGGKETLTISEYTELEKEVFSLICEESHSGATIRAAISAGVDKLISTFRTHNMYPRVIYAQKMAESILQLYETDQEDRIELMFDDREAFSHREGEDTVVPDVIKMKPEIVNDLIDDDIGDEDSDDDDIDIEVDAEGDDGLEDDLT